MIKPDGLWNFFKSGPDAETIGRVCMALAGRSEELDEPLNKHELADITMILNSNTWFEESSQRKKDQKRRDYLRKKTELRPDETAELAELTERIEKKPNLAKKAKTAKMPKTANDEISSHPSIHPSIHPEDKESIRALSENGESETGGRPLTVPTDEEMRQMARQIEIPETYVESFVADMTGLGWGYVNSGGAFVQLNRRNCKAVMRNFYNQHVNGGKKTSGRGVTVRGTGYVEGIAHGLGI